MNFPLQKVTYQEPITSVYLSNLYKHQSKKERISNNDPFSSNRMTIPIMSVEDFERKFQFNNIVRTYNNLLGNKKHNSNSVEEKENSNRLYLPIIKEIKIKKHGMNNDSNKNEFNESVEIEDSSENRNQGVRNYNKKNENSDIELYNTNQDLNENMQRSTKLLKTNSTMSQSIMFNASNLNSRLSLDNEKDKQKILFRNLSNDSIIGAYKAKYLMAIKNFKFKSKLAEIDYKKQLEKIKKEKMPISKNAKLFKEYELQFNPNTMKEKLKDEFQFFQKKIDNRPVNSTDLRLEKLFKKLKKNEEKKHIINYFDNKHSNLKPSQRTIQNIIRKEKKVELYEISLIDLAEKS